MRAFQINIMYIVSDHRVQRDWAMLPVSCHAAPTQLSLWEASTWPLGVFLPDPEDADQLFEE